MIARALSNGLGPGGGSTTRPRCVTLTLMPLTRVRIILIVAACCGLVSTAHARGVDILGRWIIAKAELAPWADPLQHGGGAEARRLVGRTVVFARHSVIGPAPLGCSRATYAVHDDTADLLFEGGLAEPDPSGKPHNAETLARGLGMKTHTVQTVETSCSEVAYHRLSPTTLVFGLNNRIYTLDRVPGGHRGRFRLAGRRIPATR